MGVNSRAGTATVTPSASAAPSRILSRANSGDLMRPHMPETMTVPPLFDVYCATTAFASRMDGS